MTGGSLDAVKSKIRALQQQADDAENHTILLQKQLDDERELRENVRMLWLQFHHYLFAKFILLLVFLRSSFAENAFKVV